MNFRFFSFLIELNFDRSTVARVKGIDGAYYSKKLHVQAQHICSSTER